ncbi:FecR family protein [Azospirillum sp. ST 5-10]|uniref:FecR family protein n=1 Tax=unclassified Azospirillum TaxID=2630922 RepID=UPI003F49FFCE
MVRSRRLAFLPVLWLLLAGAAAAQPVGEVVTLIGQAERVRGGAAEPVVRGMAVEPGDVLNTGPAGRLRIRFVDGSTGVLGVESTLTVARFAQPGGAGTRDAALELGRGILRSIAETVRPGQRFDVRTPTAVASVRSTEWIVVITPEGTGVLALDGRVAVRGTAAGAARPVVLEPGEGTDVAPGRPPTPPARWSPARVGGVTDATALP